MIFRLQQFYYLIFMKGGHPKEAIFTCNRDYLSSPFSAPHPPPPPASYSIKNKVPKGWKKPGNSAVEINDEALFFPFLPLARKRYVSFL